MVIFLLCNSVHFSAGKECVGRYLIIKTNVSRIFWLAQQVTLPTDNIIYKFI